MRRLKTAPAVMLSIMAVTFLSKSSANIPVAEREFHPISRDLLKQIIMGQVHQEFGINFVTYDPEAIQATTSHLKGLGIQVAPQVVMSISTSKASPLTRIEDSIVTVLPNADSVRKGVEVLRAIQSLELERFSSVPNNWNYPKSGFTVDVFWYPKEQPKYPKALVHRMQIHFPDLRTKEAQELHRLFRKEILDFTLLAIKEFPRKKYKTQPIILLAHEEVAYLDCLVDKQIDPLKQCVKPNIPDSKKPEPPF